ncbi:CpaF family protein [Sesbania bispinosa]|nr:CpaF family protein [Sesbania bispinosa]
MVNLIKDIARVFEEVNWRRVLKKANHLADWFTKEALTPAFGYKELQAFHLLL